MIVSQCKLLAAIILLLFFHLSANAQSAKISNVNVRHNVEQGSNKGMSISFRVDVNGMKNKKTNILAWFYDKNGDTRTNNYGGATGYSATDNHSVSFATVTPPYDSTYWESYSLFMPYSALAHEPGKNEYSFTLQVREVAGSANLCRSDYYDFSVNYGDETKRYTSSNTNSSNTNSNSASSGDVIHTHTDSPDGGHTDVYTYQDGRVFTVTSIPCNFCARTGKCTFCNGAGKSFVAAAEYSRYVPCMMCSMTGKCRNCGGTGFFTTQEWNDTKTGAYTIRSSDGVVTSGYADETGFFNNDLGETSERSSSKSSSRSNSSSRDYIWVIEYAPDYTGKAPKVWCDKCNKWDYRHAHIKKFH